MEIAERKSILEECIAYYVKDGYRIASQTETSAQMVKPKQFSGCLAVILLLLFLLPFIIYILYYLSQKDKTTYIQIDERGKITITNENGVVKKYEAASELFATTPVFVSVAKDKDPGLATNTKVIVAILAILFLVSLLILILAPTR